MKLKSRCSIRFHLLMPVRKSCSAARVNSLNSVQEPRTDQEVDNPHCRYRGGCHCLLVRTGCTGRIRRPRHRTGLGGSESRWRRCPVRPIGVGAEPGLATAQRTGGPGHCSHNARRSTRPAVISVYVGASSAIDVASVRYAVGVAVPTWLRRGSRRCRPERRDISRVPEFDPCITDCSSDPSSATLLMKGRPPIQGYSASTFSRRAESIVKAPRSRVSPCCGWMFSMPDPSKLAR